MDHINLLRGGSHLQHGRPVHPQRTRV